MSSCYFGNFGRRLLPVTAFLALLGTAGCGGSDYTAEEHLKRAKDFQEEGQYKATFIELKNGLQKNPNHAEARRMLGELYLSIGDGVAAEKELRRARDFGAAGTKMDVLIGQSLLLQRRYQEAIDKTVLSKHSTGGERASVLAVHGQAYAAMQQLDKARSSLDEALDEAPGSVPALVGLAEVFIRKGEVAAAEEKLDKALSINPESVDAWLLKGSIALSRSAYGDAEAAFNQALELTPGDILSISELKARTGLAKAWIPQKKYDEAMKAVRMLLNDAPNHPLPNYLRGLIAYEKQEYGVASDYFQKVLKASPNHVSAMMLLGATSFAEGNLEQANMYLGAVVSAAPSHLIARKLLGATRIRLQQPGEALDVLNPALSMSPDDAELLAMAGGAALRAGDIAGGTSLMEKAAELNPDAASIRTELALAYLSTGELDHAIDTLEPVTGSEDLDADSLLIQTHLRNKDKEAAFKVAEALEQKRPNDANVLLLVGRLHEAAGDRAEARAYFKRAAELQSDETTALLALAQLDLKADGFDQARAGFEQALRRQPKDTVAMIGLAQVAARQGDDKNALSWLEKARGADPEALTPRVILVRHLMRTGKAEQAYAIGQELMKAAPERPAVLSLMGQMQMATKRFNEAVTSFEKLVDKQPKSPESLLFLAQAQLATNRPEQARSSLAKALTLKPDHFPSIATLARLELRSGDAEKAMRLAAETARRWPDSPAGHTLKGELYLLQGKPAEGARAYAEAAKRRNSAVLASKRFHALLAAGEIASALAVLENWLKEHPGSHDVRLLLAQAYQREQRLHESAAAYRKVVEDQPGNFIALNNLANIYLTQGKSEALGLAKRAYGLQPDAVTGDTYGWALMKAGKYQQAETILQKAVESGQDNLETRYHYAAVLLQVGQKGKARDLLSGLMANDKPFPSREEARRLLDKL